MARRWLVTVGSAVLVLLVASAALLRTDPAPPPTPVAATVPDDLLCQELRKAAMVMADQLDRQFRRHAKAHRDYQAGRIAFGPADKPGTVLNIWRQTLHAGKLHSGHYRDLRGRLRQACLAGES